MRFLYPQSIYEIGFDFDYYGHLRTNSMYGNTRTFKGKQLAFGFKVNPSSVLSPNPKCHIVRYCDSGSHPFIYVDSGVSISRDSFRNSGYKIVRSKEKAMCVVVPQIKVVAQFIYNIAIITKTNDVYFYKFDGESLGFNKNEVGAIDNFVKEIFERRFDDMDRNDFTFIYDHENFSQSTAYTIQPCSEYEDMWNNSDEHVSYCFENDIKLTPSVEVNPELFAVWKKCNDHSMIASAVLQSDWQNYPFTIALFLAEEFPYIQAYANKALANVLNQIGFNDIKAGNYSAVTVSPEDWNMTQKCMLYELGLPEQGGFVSNTTKIPNALRQKTCVKPLYIDAPATYSSLLNMAKL